MVVKSIKNTLLILSYSMNNQLRVLGSFKIVFVVIFIFFLVNTINAQSKKKQIVLLSNRIDSLQNVIERERTNFIQFQNSNAADIDFIKNTLNQVRKDLSNANLDNEKNRELIEMQERIISDYKFKNDSLLKNISRLEEEYAFREVIVNQKDEIIKSISGLPFIGIKSTGEFWLVGFGGGFNIFYSIEVDLCGDVWLIKTISYNNWDEEKEEKERYYVGKYAPIMKGIGEFDKNEYYRISKEKFEIVDSEGRYLKLSGCCNQHAIAAGINDSCVCSEFWQ